MNKLLFALFILNLSIAFSAIPTQEQICYNDVAGFNKGVNKLIDDVLVSKDVWEIFSDLDSLDEVSYHLKTSCGNFTLDLLVKQTAGQSAAQYQACGYLVGIVGSLLEENEVPGFRGTPEGGVLLSQEAAGLSALLSKDCKITLAVDTSEATEAEEEEEEEAKAEDDENEEDEAEEDSDEPDYLINLIEVSKPGDADSGKQWSGGDYNKYMNVSDWQGGGFKRFYEAGMDEEEDDGEVPPVLLDI